MGGEGGRLQCFQQENVNFSFASNWISSLLTLKCLSRLRLSAKTQLRLRRPGHFVQLHARMHMHAHGKREIAKLIIFIRHHSGLRTCFDLIGLHPLTWSSCFFIVISIVQAWTPPPTIDPHTSQPLDGDSGVVFLS